MSKFNIKISIMGTTVEMIEFSFYNSSVACLEFSILNILLLINHFHDYLINLFQILTVIKDLFIL